MPISYLPVATGWHGTASTRSITDLNSFCGYDEAMTKLWLLVALTACTETAPTDTLPKCAKYPVSQDIACESSGNCSWRGIACSIDECGVPPSYPGYAVSPQSDGTIKMTNAQWNDLSAWVDAERNFQFCEASL